MTLRKKIAIIMMASILLGGCGSAKAEQTAPAQADTAEQAAPAQADTAEQAAPAQADTAEQAAPAQADTAEQAAPAQADTAEQAAPAQADTAEQATVEAETSVATRENPLIVVDTDESLEFFYENGEIIMIFDGKEVIIKKNLREEIHSGNILEEDLPGQLRASIRLERAKRR